jgi:hypothetical protein
MAKVTDATEHQTFFAVTAVRKLRAGEVIAPTSRTSTNFGPYLSLVNDMDETLKHALGAAECEADVVKAMDTYWSAVRLDKRYRAIVEAVDAQDLADGVREVEPPPEAAEGALKPYTIRALMAKTFPERRWAVRPFFPEGLAILAGPPGSGKSYYALNLALAVAQGGMAFGTLPTERGDVLYLSFEDDEMAMQERIDTLWQDDAEPFPDNLYVQHEGVPKLGAGLVETLSAWLDGHPDARLIVIDVLGDVKPPRTSGGDWYLDDKALLTPLRRLANTRHVAIVLLHHTNRRENPDNPFEMIHGGAGIEGTPDTKAVLMRGVGKSDAVLAIRGRAVPEQRAAFAYSAGIWTYLGEAEDFSRTQERQDIMAFLSKTPDPVKPAHVAVMLGRDPVNVRQLMRKMARQGEIKLAGYGMYTTHHTPTDSDHTAHTAHTAHSDHTDHSSLESTTYAKSHAGVSPLTEINGDKSDRATTPITVATPTLPRASGQSDQCDRSRQGGMFAEECPGCGKVYAQTQKRCFGCGRERYRPAASG